MSEAVQAGLPQAQEPSSVRLALTLGIAGLLSGIALVLVYEVTRPHIEAHAKAALQAAIFRVVPGATGFAKLSYDGSALAPAADDTKDDVVYAVWGEGDAFLGWAVSGEGAGFQDTIRLIWGLSPDGQKVLGMEVLDSRETPGLGDKIFKDPAFVAEFAGLATEPAPTVVPNGKGSAPHEVDSITGATISSKAVVAIINAGNEVWRPRLPSAPPVPRPAKAAAADKEEP